MNKGALAAAVFVTHICVAQVITTVAGGAGVFRGDGGAAVQATLGEMRGVAVDAQGNVYAADLDHSIVVKITPSGVITVVAGNGIRGFSGDGGPATSAALNYPHGLVVDSVGNLYIADAGNLRVRKVSPNGIISTVAGKDGSADFTGDGGPATSASLRGPIGIALDGAGNLYFTDNCNHRVRKVDTTGTITTVAGSGPVECANGGYSGDGGSATSARLNRPNGVAVDSAGNLYVGDTGNHRIRKISANGTITTVAGNGQGAFSGDGGLAISASLATPWWVAVDAGGLYIGDSRRIRKVNPAGIITTIAGSGQEGFSGDGGPATAATMTPAGFQPGVAVDVTGNLYIADTSNYRIRKVVPSGIISTIAGVGPQGFGDGGPATSAALGRPNGLAVDRAGNLYIADARNNRVRRVTPSGLIATFAGTGTAGFSGDGGFATSAELNQPLAVAFDSAGNLYIADMLNGRIRRVTPDGIISTAAGGGSGGDGGQAVDVALSGPQDVAFDVLGNLYIAETFGNRIRKVDRNGIISTVAGNGLYAFSGDGGAATSASLAGPEAIVVDRAGNLYIADTSNFRIRRVSPGGIITTIAGIGRLGTRGDGGPALSAELSQLGGLALDSLDNLYIAEHSGVRKVDSSGIITRVTGNFGFAGDGGLVGDASLSAPKGLAFDAFGQLYIADTENDRIRVVLAAPPTFSVVPTSLAMSSPAGSETLVTRQIAVNSQVIGLGWNAQTSASWLSLSTGTGTVPGILTISVDASGLTQGTYRGTVTITAPLAAPTTQTVTLDLTVTSPLAPQLTVEPGSVVVEVPINTGNPPQQTLRITNNGGGGALRWTAQGEVFGAGNWLGVLSTSGSASGRAPGSIPVRVNVAGLQPGIYSGLVRVASQAAGQTQDVPVTLLLSQQTKTILTTQTILRFTAAEGGRPTGAQSLGIINTAQGTMDWTVRPSTLSGGSWLSVTPGSGQSVAGAVNLATAAVQVNPAGLSAGFYIGELTVTATGANNSPYRVHVNLEVLPAGASAGVQIRPPQLIFTAQAGTTSPSSQTLRLATPRRTGVEARGGVLTLEGGNWLQVLPSSLVVSADDPRTVVVQPNLGNLAPGVYRGAVTFQDGTETQAVDIIFLVVGTPLGAASRGEAAVCAPQKLIAADRTLGNNFTATAGSGTSLEVQVVDDCANPVADATLVASFSNDDRPVTLTSLGNGTYVGTWRPATAAPQATVTIRANTSSLATEVRAQGRVQADDKTPALFAGGIVNAASFMPGVPLAPGSIVSVFGRNLAASGNASSWPLPRTLGGATLSIAGVDVPLFFTSSGQLNAQLPFELQANTRQQAALRGAGTITLPETITIVPARPGIFTLTQNGTGQGAILDAQYRLVDANAPAAVGDVVAVYATGLGATDPVGVTGQAAGPTLSRVIVPVTATVGGRPATVQFAGLAPGFVGLYQVNVQIPSGVAPGPASLVLSQNGVPSNSVTLNIR